MASVFDKYKHGGHGVAESTLIKSTKVGHHYNLVAEVDIDNGSLAKIGDFVKSDVFKADIPAKGDKVVLILTAPKIYEEFTTKMQEEDNFYNAAGENMRAYELQDTDRFTVSAECFNDDADPEKGKYVVMTGAGYKMTTLDTEPTMSEYGFVGYIYDISKNGRYRVFINKNAQVEA